MNEVRTYPDLKHGYRCFTHNYHFGPWPCPWPKCENGVDADVLVDGMTGNKMSRAAWPLSVGEFYSWFSPDAPLTINADRAATWAVEQEIIPHWPEVVYHYTDVDALLSIVQSNALWLTDYRFTNDASELEHGLLLTRNAISEFSYEGCPSSVLREFLESVTAGMAGQLPAVAIFSACERDDSLSQWRAYSRDTRPVSIGFRSAELVRVVPDCRLRSIRYQETTKSKTLRAILEAHTFAYGWDLEHCDLRISPSRYREVVRDLACSRLVEAITTFKDPAFEDEREYRLAYIPIPVFAEMGRTLAPKQFRVRRGIVLPYITTSDILAERRLPGEPNPHLPIVSITVGPMEKSELVKAGIESLLRERRADRGIDVRLSNIPYRGW
jgi:hypothetical protein